MLSESEIFFKSAFKYIEFSHGSLLNNEELLVFLSSKFSDGTLWTSSVPRIAASVMSQSNSLLKIDRKNELYVEIVRSGSFRRVYGASFSVNDRAAQTYLNPRCSNEINESIEQFPRGSHSHSLTSDLNKTKSLVSILWVMCQGLLAGAALLPFLQTKWSYALNLSDILLFFYSTSGEARRLLFILSTLSFVGALDQCFEFFSVKMQKNSSGSDQRVRIYIASLHACCLVATLSCATIDVFAIELQDIIDENDAQNWIVQSSLDGWFQMKVDEWLIGCGIRAVTSMIAWMLSCWQVYTTLANRSVFQSHENFQCQEAKNETKLLPRYYNGKDLQELDNVELTILVQEMQMRLNEASKTLENRYYEKIV